MLVFTGTLCSHITIHTNIHIHLEHILCHLFIVQIGRLMLRKLIHQVTRIPYNKIELARSEKGKPYLVNQLPRGLENFSFNVSHHGEMVVLAAETNCDVGIDVMKLETPGKCISKRHRKCFQFQTSTFFQLVFNIFVA